jgi:CzcA family heavy metal efflux pump
MLNALIAWSLKNRLLVVAASVLLVVVGSVVGARIPVDVFPDLTAPTVTVVTEAHGLAPEEVETLVTWPIETAVNGASGVRRVRSASGVGISIVWVEFAWGTHLPSARQIVNEKLQIAGPQLPADIAPPQMAPTSSVMGEILFLSLGWAGEDPSTGMQARTVADQVLRKRLLGVPGVSQVVPIGGGVKQVQVLLRPEALSGLDVTFEQVAHAIRTGNGNASGGFVSANDQEYLVRVVGRAVDADALGDAVVAVREGRPILVRQLGDVRIGPKVKRGEGSANGRPAVVMAVLKQPDANTLEVTARIDTLLDELEPELPAGLVLDRRVFRQADFISTAVRNVGVALRDGAVLVAVILMLFLGNLRASFVSLAAIPVSLVAAVLALDALGLTLDTMTLGGLTIAIGSVVDDAIIDVENVFRRLRENRARPEGERRAPLDVIYAASVEIRTSIVFATLIIVLVFLPLFFLDGIEGRMLAPLGTSYVIALLASLAVAMTLTPALCAYVLPNSRVVEHGESRVAGWSKRVYGPLLDSALARPTLVLGVAAAAFLASLAVVPFLGRTFLPEFNEGALTINVVTKPGTSLKASDRLGRRVETALLAFPEVVSTSRRTGRAELDEHAQDVNAAEIDVMLDLEKGDRDRVEFLEALRADLATIGGANITVGQPLSHRIDHLLSGTRSAIAVKLFGEDLEAIRLAATKIEAVAKTVPGAVDVSIEQQVDIPEFEVRADRLALARYGLGAGELGESVERALVGETVSAILEGQRPVDVVVRLADVIGGDLAAIGTVPIDTPVGARVPLGAVAEVLRGTSPNTIVREGGSRKMVVQANVAGRDLASVVDELRARVRAEVDLGEDVFVVYGGQFESASAAARTIAGLSAVVVAGVYLLLVAAFGSARNALLMLVNLPLSLIGGIMALALTSGTVSTPALVGFVTLFGIATRNGILMVTHYEHLVSVDGLDLEEAVRRGSIERLVPVLMTALAAGLALLPLVVAGDHPGNEIQAPMGVVMLGGLLSSTVLNMFVVPVLFRRFGVVVGAR